MAEPLVLMFTDFGADGPYLAQMEAAIYAYHPPARVLNLCSNAPAGDPRRAGYLLAALRYAFPPGTVFLAVVDPGVGGDRQPVIVHADDQWLVGPDNGLFYPLARQAQHVEWWVVDWRPPRLSNCFHGRDLFAPLAAQLAAQRMPGQLRPWSGPALAEWPADVPELVHFDVYGNAISGIRWKPALDGAVFNVNGRIVEQARTFSCVTPGAVFWHANSCGLVEIAVNLGNARQLLGLQLGGRLGMEPSAAGR